MYSEEGKTKKVEIGEQRKSCQEKVILLVGGTGSGKSTLVNGMLNYLMGVNWEDEYRLKLIDDTIFDETPSHTKSQTREIKVYKIHHNPWFKVPYTVTVIDTPGFGDTDGVERDKKIVKHIETLFKTKGENGIDRLDAIGFVTQSSLPRLTPIQQYIFDSVLSLFGNDVASNIFLLLTFADGQKPQVLSGIKQANMPYMDYFKFNNCVLYVSSKATEDDDRLIDKIFLELGGFKVSKSL